MTSTRRPPAFVLLLLSLSLVTTVAGCPWTRSSRLPGYLHLRLNTDPSTLDPALITDVTGGNIAAKIFNGLVRFDLQLNIIPDLARTWDLSPDRRTYLFHLRTDATFSNGRPVTAQDVQYSFERVLDPRTRAPLTWVLDRIAGAQDIITGRAMHAAGIRVIDDHTLSVRLERPFGPFLSLLGMTTAYIVPREAVERLREDFGSAPVGSGPYIVEEWTRGQNVTLRARKDYFGGRPRLAGIRYRVIPEDLTAVMEFETGSIDVLQVPASEYRRYTTDPLWRDRVHARPGLNTYYLGLNCERPPFDDLRVRQAANMAIDRERILNTLYEKRGLLASGPIPPLLWKGHRKPTTVPSYPYDPDQARRLLHAAGAEHAQIRIFISAEPEVLDIVEVVQEYLRKVGINAQIVQLDWSAFKQAINRGDAEAFWLSWWADYPDPENFLYPLFHSSNAGPAGNRAWYHDPALDRLIEQAQATTNEGDRYQLYEQAERRIVQNAPWVFMWHRNDISAVQPWVKDFTIYPIYSVDKGMDLAVGK